MRWNPFFRGAGLLTMMLGAACSAAQRAPSVAIASSAPPVKQLTICFSGAAAGDPYSSGGNEELRDLCQALPNLIRGKSYPFFTWNQWTSTALDAFVAAADTNHDGKVTSEDEAFELNVLGFSWGGFNARDFIQAIQDSRHVEQKSVAHFFAMDPFKVTLLVPKSGIDVPSNVRQFWSFRHSKAPASDCSAAVPYGPFTGRKPTCSKSTQCVDYDFSLAPPSTMFSGRQAVSIGHCELPGVSTRAILALAAGEPAQDMPPTVPVQRAP